MDETVGARLPPFILADGAGRATRERAPAAWDERCRFESSIKSANKHISRVLAEKMP